MSLDAWLSVTLLLAVVANVIATVQLRRATKRMNVEYERLTGVTQKLERHERR